MLSIIIKFIIFLSLILTGYSISVYLKCYNYFINISFLDYSIEVNFIFGIGILLLAILIVNIILNGVFFIISIPKKLLSYKDDLFKSDPRKIILSYYTKFVLNDNNLSAEELLRSLNYIPQSLMYHIHFIILRYTKDFTQTITSLKYLMSNSEYKNYATKKLVHIYLGIGKLEEALVLVESLPNNNDIEALLLALDAYAKLKLYSKFSNVVNKLNKLDKNLWADYQDKIANYFFDAAKNSMIINSNNNEVKFLLDSALLYKSNMFEAIELYCSFNEKLNQAQKNIALIKGAFSVNPSFELFQLYLRYASEENVEIYNSLILLINKEKHFNLFLIMASYLKLFDEIEKLVASKPYIPYYI